MGCKESNSIELLSQWNITQKKNEVLSSGITWMDLDRFMLRKTNVI